MAQKFDTVVIGGGPGGYVAAIRLAQLGHKVACVEKRATLGGTCLNVGCIPSKALLHASERYHEAGHGLAALGIKTGKVALDLPQMMNHKNKVVADNCAGIEFLFKKNKVTWLKGTGSFTSANQLRVTADDGSAEDIDFTHAIIATGSAVASLPGITIDEERIVSSTGALELPAVPNHLVVVGGGYIGLELGTVWQRLGSQVTVVEYLDRILPAMDAEIAKNMQRILTKQGLKFELGHKVVAAKSTKTGVTLQIEPAAGGTPKELQADYVLVAVGRRPYTDGLGLDKAGVQLDERGRVKVDDHLRSSQPHIYAIGDVTTGPMLAHKAEEDGVAVAEWIAGQKPHLNYDLVPGVVYTWPEVAQIGKTEEELKKANIAYNVGKFPFSANGRARAMASTDGFVKILADKATDAVLGVHIIGPEAGTLIAEIAIAMEFGASSEDIARTCHAHPTLNEAVKEAALAVAGRPIHI